MPVNRHTLSSMQRIVQAAKPNCPADTIKEYLNASLRFVMDLVTYWADLESTQVLSIPAVYNTGTVAAATGSPVVTGTSTAWPVSDVVSTTLASAILDAGYQEIELGSRVGVDFRSVLLVDVGTPSEEVVPLVRVDDEVIEGKFRFPHNAGATVTMSSLVNRQIRFGGNHPAFTILGVRSATSLIMDMAWGDVALSGGRYTILQQYVMIAPYLKDVLAVINRRAGIPMEPHTAQHELDAVDPQRTATGDPVVLADLRPSVGGVAQFELWPAPVSAQQIEVRSANDWPEMRRPSDRPPPFLNPSIFIDQAKAEALRTKIGEVDPYFNPVIAREIDMRSMALIEAAKNANDGRILKSYQREAGFSRYPYGTTFAQSHDPDWMFGNL